MSRLPLVFMVSYIMSQASNVTSSVRYTYTKSQRLLTPVAFREVFDAPERKLHQSHLMAFVRSNSYEQPRVGMAITKRKVPTAVARNLIKRQIREQFRIRANDLEDKDIVFIVKKSIKGLSKIELKNEINNIFKKIEKK